MKPEKSRRREDAETLCGLIVAVAVVLWIALAILMVTR